MGVFVKAGPAEILRAAQKDEALVQQLQGMFENVFLKFLGPRFSMKYKRTIYGLSNIFYYFNTTLSGLQTLGEEYTGIVQVDCSMRKMPGYFNRLIMVVFESYGLLLTLWLCKKIEKYVKDDENIVSEAKEHIIKFISIFKTALPHIDKVHKAYFFCNWGTYHLSKRLTGIHYVLARFWLKDRISIPAFKILGGVTMVQLFITAVIALRKLYNINLTSRDSRMLVTPENPDKTKKCTMCLSNYQNPSCTPCGHIFCWNCILEWLQTENQCPICRESVLPSRVVPLKNYC